MNEKDTTYQDPRIQLIKALGEAELQRVTKRVIRQFQRTVVGDDALEDLHEHGLQNPWEAYCVQIQGEEWTIWPFFQSHLELIVQAEMKTLSTNVIDMLWLISEPGIDWQYDLENDDIDEETMHLYEHIPSDDADVMGMIISSLNHVAMDYSSQGIIKYNSQYQDNCY